MIVSEVRLLSSSCWQIRHTVAPTPTPMHREAVKDMASQLEAFLPLFSCLKSIWEQLASPAVHSGGPVTRLPEVSVKVNVTQEPHQA